MMISFIIIGRNEALKIYQCIQSVYNTITYNRIENFEIIYVDSNSIDDSIERVKKFDKVRIIHLIGDYNAAIARNVGFEVSKGKVLFFIDGDMELFPEVFENFYSEKKGLIKEFVSGDFINYYYDSDGNFLEKKRYHNNKCIKRSFTTGGLFLISRELWLLVGGMRNEFRRSQDLDLGLRLAKKNIFLYRLPIILSKHHTVAYRSSGRKWKMLFNFSQSYGRAYLYRMNFFNYWCWRLMFRNDYSFVILVIFILFSAFNINSVFYFNFFYLLVVIIRSIKINKIKIPKVLEDIVYFILRDFIQILCFVFFYPKRKFIIKYKSL